MMLQKCLLAGICMIFTALPFLRNTFGIFATFAAVLINIGCLLSIFYYYHRLPCEKQTILVFLVQCYTLYVACHILQSFLIDTVLFLFGEDSLHSHCYLLPIFWLGLTWYGSVLILIEILVFKIIQMRSTVTYLHMNTKTVKIVCVTIFVLPMSLVVILRFANLGYTDLCHSTISMLLKQYSSTLTPALDMPMMGIAILFFLSI